MRQGRYANIISEKEKNKTTRPMLEKKPKDSAITMTEIVLPNDTNALGNLRGGKILHWMDIASAIAAGKHSNSVVVTASVDNVSFENPIKLGDVVILTAKVTRTFNTSMETHIEVWAENLPSQTRYKCNEAYYTFVALDSNGRPKKAHALVPETEEEIKMYASALARRELRLVLAGRLKMNDSKELKKLFEAEVL
jgi:acyl-CoA hydrolase